MATQELLFAIAFPIIPLWLACASAGENVYLVSCSAVTKAILSFMIAWLILLPICELHWSAVFCPFPSTLHPVGGASDPKHGIPSSVELTQNKFICRLRGDRRQMTPFLPAEIFGVIPVQSSCAPVVAVIPIFHPVFLAGFNALFIFASQFRSCKIDEVIL